MEEYTRDPEALLRRVEREEDGRARGRLEIFFGYAAGVGKTYAMLEAAHAAKARGGDVVIGYVEPHARPQTALLQNGLEALPAKEVPHGGMVLREFDLDAALSRKPGLVLVDELAHTNAGGCRHLKRYQDVKELLDNGIDVYTTVNVQHLESLNDRVASITGVTVQERIPDSVFDNADLVRLVDIEPKELIERLREGKVYGEEQARRALGNFFTLQNLVALREIALRRCADRVNRMSEQSGGRANSRYTAEHVLVCLSSSPSNPKIIRTAARLAGAFRGKLTALFVETPDFPNMGGEDKDRLRQNIRLAERLGAQVETAYGDDIAFQISEFARLSGVSKIVLGRSSARRGLLPGRAPLTEKITRLSPDLDIYIIPDRDTPRYRPGGRAPGRPGASAADLLKSALALAASTALGFLFDRLGFSEANIIIVYLLGVLVTAVVTSRRAYSLAGSAVSVLLFNFFFTTPRLSLEAYDPGYPATFAIMFLAAFLASSLTVRVKRQARQSAETAYRMKVLFDTNRLLAGERDPAGIVPVACRQLTKLLGRGLLFYGVRDGALQEPLWFPARGGQGGECYLTENERAVAAWVCRNNKRAGATTDTLGSAKCLYLSVRLGREVYGVVGIAIDGAPLDAFENSVMLSILGECALALKNGRGGPPGGPGAAG